MIKHFPAAIFVLIVFTATISAQRSIEEAAKSARDQFSDLKNRSIELERMKREAAKRPTDDNETRAFPAIKDDFEKIQKINDHVLALTAGNSPINYAAVLKSTSEINERAVRLKSNLFSAESEQKKIANNNANNKPPVVAESPDLPTLVKVLDKSIARFVHSSLFQNVKLVNSRDSLAAQNDLESVIKTSRLIKEKAKKLKREISKR